MSEVIVKATLNLIKSGRRTSFTEVWTHDILKQEGWGTADFQPFAVEETVEDGFMAVRRNRYYLKIESVNPLTNEVFASYTVARSKAWPIERCLMGCGWTRGYTQKTEAV